jgi:hypothetical protein
MYRLETVRESNEPQTSDQNLEVTLNNAIVPALQSLDITEYREGHSFEEAQDAIKRVLAGLDNREHQLQDAIKLTYAMRGWAALIAEERELYAPYATFDEWLRIVCPKSFKYVLDAMRAVKELESIPYADLLQMPRCNIKLLLQASSGLRDKPEVIEAAKTQPENLFREMLNLNGQHLEATEWPKWKFTAGDYKAINVVFEHIAVAYEEAGGTDLTTPELRLMALVNDYIVEHGIEIPTETIEGETT